MASIPTATATTSATAEKSKIADPHLSDNENETDVELLQKLVKLQQLHEQILDLRTLLPDRLIQPARRAIAQPRQVTPPKMAAQLSQAATNGFRDLAQFRQEWHEEPVVQKIWQATNSNPLAQGSSAWTANYDVLLREATNQLTTANASSSPSSIESPKEVEADTLEDAKAALSRFQESKVSEGVKLTTPSSQRNGGNGSGPSAHEIFPLRLELETAQIVMEITRTNKDSEKSGYTVRKLPSRSLLTSQVMEWLVQQTREMHHLDRLLQFLASYKTLLADSCEKCKEQWDVHFKIPVARKFVSEQSPGQRNKLEPLEYQAFHIGCL